MSRHHHHHIEQEHNIRGVDHVLFFIHPKSFSQRRCASGVAHTHISLNFFDEAFLVQWQSAVISQSLIAVLVPAFQRRSTSFVVSTQKKWVCFCRFLLHLLYSIGNTVRRLFCRSEKHGLYAQGSCGGQPRRFRSFDNVFLPLATTRVIGSCSDTNRSRPAQVR